MYALTTPWLLRRSTIVLIVCFSDMAYAQQEVKGSDLHIKAVTPCNAPACTGGLGMREGYR